MEDFIKKQLEFITVNLLKNTRENKDIQEELKEVKRQIKELQKENFINKVNIRFLQKKNKSLKEKIKNFFKVY